MLPSYVFFDLTNIFYLQALASGALIVSLRWTLQRWFIENSSAWTKRNYSYGWMGREERKACKVMASSILCCGWEFHSVVLFRSEGDVYVRSCPRSFLDSLYLLVHTCFLRVSEWILYRSTVESITGVQPFPVFGLFIVVNSCVFHLLSLSLTHTHHKQHIHKQTRTLTPLSV